MSSLRSRWTTATAARLGVSGAAAAVIGGALLVACRAFDAEAEPPSAEPDSGVGSPDLGAERDAATPPSSPEAGGDAARDADPDGAAPCNDDQTFGTPKELTDLGDVTSVRLTADGATAFVASVVSATDEEIHEGPFPKMTLLYARVVDSAETDTHPAPVSDPLRLFYEHGTPVSRAVVIGERAQIGQPFVVASTPSLGASGAAQTREPYALGDGSVLYFTMQSGAERALRRASSSAGVWSVVAVPGISSGLGDGHPVVAEDELTLFFSRGAPADIWMATRATVAAPFTAALPLAGTINGSSDDRPTWLSRDRCTLLFTSNRSGGFRAYSASRR